MERHSTAPPHFRIANDGHAQSHDHYDDRPEREHAPVRTDGGREREHDRDLDRIAPSTVLDLYVTERKTDLADRTRRSHRYVIERFVEWCDENEIPTVAALDGRDLHEFQMDRRQDVSGNTLRSQLGTIRQYLRFAESIEAASPGLAERIRLPEVERHARDGRLETAAAESILEHLRRFQYASRDHAVLCVLWTTGIRVGTAHAFDVTDFDRDEQLVATRHRPGQGTPLKNGQRGERLIALDDRTVETLADYVEHNRTDVTDEHDRRPLFTTDRGRMGVSTIRRAVYRWTRPCQRGSGCPHDRDLDDCEARQVVSKASQCPSTHSPHEVRRGAISRFLNEDTPVRAISDRADVSEGVLDKHYDARSEREKADARREFFE
jgi:site-specific recombinase XerD